MTSYCLKCHKLVPSGTPVLHSGAFLLKNCPDCGINMELIEPDHDFFHNQESLPRTETQNDCYMVDITQKCDAGCTSCYNRGTEHRSITEFMEEVDATPKGSRILISGGEPLQRPNFETFFEYVSNTDRYPILLTNGAYLSISNYEKLLSAGLQRLESPQIAVSLGLPHTNKTFQKAFANLHRMRVADIAFTISNLTEIESIEEIAASLRGQYEAICIRTAWDGNKTPLFVSEIVTKLGGDLLPTTIHGYRTAMVEKRGIIYKIVSWPSFAQYDVERYANRGVWYKGDNVVATLVKRHAAALSL